MSILSDLAAQLPPPKNPLDSGTPELWRLIEAKLQLELPDDYKEFIDNYGSGLIARTLTIYSPFSQDITNLLRAGPQWCNLIRQTIDENEIDFPFEFYPEPASLFCFAETCVSHKLFWLTASSNPSQWPIILGGPYMELGEYEQYDVSFVELLLGLVTRNIQSDLWGNLWEEQEVTFDPRGVITGD